MTELLVVFVVGLLVLGPKRLPQVARSLGRSLAEFRRASTDLRREFMDVADGARIDLNAVPDENSDVSQPRAGESEDPEAKRPPPPAAKAPAEGEDPEPAGG